MFLHAAMDTGSQESLYGDRHYRMYTPPVTKPKNNVFFSSDDNLYRTEVRQLQIPRIQIDYEPEFKLQITDFSEPNPRDVTFEYEDEFVPLGIACDYAMSSSKSAESWKDKSSIFSKQKSHSLDVKDTSFIDIEQCSDSEAYLTISSNSKKLKQMSTSLQDLSSSTSSINSVIHDSNLDLSQLDSPIKQKNWKSPDEIRHGYVKSLARQFEYAFNKKKNVSCTVSVPNLNKLCDSEDELDIYKSRRYKSATQLSTKLNEYEREILQRLLQDWSLHGSKGMDPEDIDLKECDGNESSTLKKFILNNDTSELPSDFKLAENESREIRNSNPPSDEPKLKRLLFSELRSKPVVKFSNEDIHLSSCELCNKEETNVFKLSKRNLTSEDYTKYFKSNLKKTDKPFHSEPDLSPKTRSKLIRDNLIYIAKYNSESNLSKPMNFDLDIMHKCQYRNCIFNSDYFNNVGPSDENIVKDEITDISAVDIKSSIENIDEKQNNKKLKGILKNSNEKLNIENWKDSSKREPMFLKNITRRHSEIIDSKSFNNQLIRCGSLERLTKPQMEKDSRALEWKKFPESYIVRKNTKNFSKSGDNQNSSEEFQLIRNDSLTRRAKNSKPKVIVLKRKYYPKTWKSCSDIKNRQKPIRKCCRYAKTTCPILRGTSETKRRTQSCADVSVKDDIYLGFKYADIGNFDCKICRYLMSHNFI